MTEVAAGTPNTGVAPLAVLGGHPDDAPADRVHDPWAARSATVAAGVCPRDQLSMPAEEGIGRDQRAFAPARVVERRPRDRHQPALPRDAEPRVLWVDHRHPSAGAQRPKAFDKKSRSMTSSPIFARSSLISVSREASCRSLVPREAGQYLLSPGSGSHLSNLSEFRGPPLRQVVPTCRFLGLITNHTEAAVPNLFSDISWSTSSVLDDTMNAARRAGLRVELVQPWYDVDDEVGLAKLREELRDDRGRARAPSTAQVLEEITAPASPTSPYAS